MDTELLIREVRDAAGRVAVSLEAVEEARRAVHRAALRALVAVEGDAERERELVRVLYWDVPALPVKTIAAVIGTPSQVRALAGPGPLLGRCDVCDAEVHATSRTHRTQGTARLHAVPAQAAPGAAGLPLGRRRRRGRPVGRGDPDARAARLGCVRRRRRPVVGGRGAVVVRCRWLVTETTAPSR